MTTRSTKAAALVIAAGVGLYAAPLLAQGHEHDHPAPDHGKIFEKRCANCHVVPDSRFATDRAWLGQIMETA